MLNNRTIPKEKKKQSFIGNLFSYLPSGNALFRGLVMLLAVQSSIPGAVATPTGRFLPKIDGLKLKFTDKDCVNADPDCKLEAQYTGLVDGIHSYDGTVHCDGPGTVIPEVNIAIQIRNKKALGQQFCEGVVTDLSPDMENGIVHFTQTNLKADLSSSNPMAISVSQNSIFTKKLEQPKAPECPTPPAPSCNLFVNGILQDSINLNRWINGVHESFSCRPH